MSLSLVLVAFGVTSVLMLFPIGIKAEQMARLRLYAGVKAGEIIESFSTQSNENPAIDVEAPFQWEVPSGHRPFCPDLEARVATSRYGIMPVPREIALRIDSENDEIRRVLDQGGQLYYSKATGASGFQAATEGDVSTPTDPLTQRLVFAVSGHAQNNAVPYLAQKTWPYHTPYPGPPSFGLKRYFRNVDQPSVPPMSTDASFLGGPQKHQFSLWEGVTAGVPLASTIGRGERPTGSLDPDIRLVFACGYRPYAFDKLVDNVTLGDRDQFVDVPAASIPDVGTISLYFRRQLGAERYLQMALWYCRQKSLPSEYTDFSAADPIVEAKNTAERFKSVPDDQKWKYVQALRFLSHAATCLSKWARADGTNSTTETFLAKDRTPVDPRTGMTIRAMTIEVIGTTTMPAKTIIMPEKRIDHNAIVYYHELCMRLVMSYSASQPYDWGAPRPTQRALFTDYPLIEYDLFNEAQGLINGSGRTARQWKPVTGSPVTNIGRSASFPNVPIPDTTWGDAGNFTLAKQFEPAERCRQLTFWAADWMSYEDFESAPSAPLDASRYLFSAPIPTASGGALPFDANRSPPPAGAPPTDRMNASQWYDQYLYAFRNPEHATLFSGGVANVPTGYELKRGGYGFNGFGARQNDRMFDFGSGGYNKAMFRGEFGGDRNFNNKLDRGPLPKSIRIRATTVARYAFYDPRLTVRLR